MFNVVRRGKGRSLGLGGRRWRDRLLWMKHERVFECHMRAAAKTRIGGRIVVTVVMIRRLSRNVAFVRVENVAGENLHDDEGQHDHRCDADRLRQNPHGYLFCHARPADNDARPDRIRAQEVFTSILLSSA